MNLDNMPNVGNYLPKYFRMESAEQLALVSLKAKTSEFAELFPVARASCRPPNSKIIDSYDERILKNIVSFINLADFMQTIPLLSVKWYKMQSSVGEQKSSFILIPRNSIASDSVPAITNWAKYSGLKIHTPRYDTIVCKNAEFWSAQSGHAFDLAKRKFPNIASVSIIEFINPLCNPNSNCLQDKLNTALLVRLFNTWPNLTELKIIADEYYPEKAHLELLYKQLNSLKCLKHLTLFSRSHISQLATRDKKFETFDQIDKLVKMRSAKRMEIWDDFSEMAQELKRLEKFEKQKELKRLELLNKFGKFDVNRLDVILPQLESLYLGSFSVHFTRLASIRRLGIWYMRSSEYIERLYLMDNALAHKLTHLTILPEVDHLNVPFLHMVARKFPELQYLHVCTKLPLSEVIAPLSKLTKLKYLRIWHFHSFHNKVPNIGKRELEKLEPLFSVELVHLYIRLCTHTQLEWVSRIFPNLKWIKLDMFASKCPECTGPEQKVQCERLMLKPLKKCTRLIRVYLDRTGIAINNCPLEHINNDFEELARDDL